MRNYVNVDLRIMLVSQEMGDTTSDVFAGVARGNIAIEMTYSHSADFFAEQIKNTLKVGTEFSLVDVGSFSGELLKNVLVNLNEYKVDTFVIDVNEEALSKNIANHKILCSADDIKLADKSIDVTISRYALQWNLLDTQKIILKEMARVTRKLIILEHAGAGVENAKKWREKTDEIFSGKIVKKLKRDICYYSTKKELINLIEELGLRYKILEENKILGISDIWSKRYDLNDEESEKVKKTLEEQDFFVQTRLILYP